MTCVSDIMLMKKCPNCNSTRIKTAIFKEKKEMRTKCVKCGYIHITKGGGIMK